MWTVKQGGPCNHYSGLFSLTALVQYHMNKSLSHRLTFYHNFNIYRVIYNLNSPFAVNGKFWLQTCRYRIFKSEDEAWRLLDCITGHGPPPMISFTSVTFQEMFKGEPPLSFLLMRITNNISKCKFLKQYYSFFCQNSAG